MVSPRLCAVWGEGASVTACLLSQILAGRGRTGLAALTSRYDGTPEPLLRALERLNCRSLVVALPETACALDRRADTAVLLSCGMGEAAERLMRGCDRMVVNLDDPDGVPERDCSVPVWTISERRDEADLTARNLRLLPYRTEFEAVSGTDICRLSVPLPGGVRALPRSGCRCGRPVLRRHAGGERPTAAPGGACPGGDDPPAQVQSLRRRRIF